MIEVKSDFHEQSSTPNANLFSWVNFQIRSKKAEANWILRIWSTLIKQLSKSIKEAKRKENKN